MEKLVEVSNQVVCIDFVLGTKCRAAVRLRSLSAITAIAFKIQTSSPHKFLVNPPSGLISPLSQITFHIILKPQPQIPSSFPRSVSDRFLIRTGHVRSTESTQLADSVDSDSEALWSYDIKLKVAFVGPFLLRHAVNNGDCDAVRGMIKFQKTILAELSTREAESLHRVANSLENSVEMASLLLEAGLKVDSSQSTNRNLDDVDESKWVEKGWTELHVAVAFDRTDEVLRLIKTPTRGLLDRKDKEGRSPLHLAASKGHERCVKVLAGAGGNVDSRRNDGWTALYRAAAKGNRRMVKVLVDLGADPSIVVENRSAMDVARDEGHKEIVEILERGEAVLNAARRGDLTRLEFLLETDASVHFQDQYGLTAIHMAAIKGHKDVVMLLVEFGSDLECTDNDGRTPLHLAAVGGSKETVEVLINRGANLNAKCKKGATPFQVAKKMGYEVVIQFLLLNQAIS